MDNYRPISLLSSFSKIMEKIVASRLLTFLDNNNILTKWQFGFRAGHSTSHPMVHFINKVTEALNRKKHTIGIFCDLKKAFDTCDPSILLMKLKKYFYPYTYPAPPPAPLPSHEEYICSHRRIYHMRSIYFTT